MPFFTGIGGGKETEISRDMLMLERNSEEAGLKSVDGQEEGGEKADHIPNPFTP